MKIKYFPDTGTLLMQFNDNEAYKTSETSRNVCVDPDKNGTIVAMTIEHAKSSAGAPWEFACQEMGDD